MNWDLIVVAMIAAFPSTIAALAAWRQAKKTHLSVNSRMDEIIRLTRQVAVFEEKAAEKVRQADALLTPEQREATTYK